VGAAALACVERIVLHAAPPAMHITWQPLDGQRGPQQLLPQHATVQHVYAVAFPGFMAQLAPRTNDQISKETRVRHETQLKVISQCRQPNQGDAPA
jgi:hypothetical protein